MATLVVEEFNPISLSPSLTADSTMPAGCHVVHQSNYLERFCTIAIVVLQGKPPTVDVVSELYQLLIEAGSRLRQPVALEEQLLKHNGLSSDVGKSMLQLLQVHLLQQLPATAS